MQRYDTLLWGFFRMIRKDDLSQCIPSVRGVDLRSRRVFVREADFWIVAGGQLAPRTGQARQALALFWYTSCLNPSLYHVSPPILPLFEKSHFKSWIFGRFLRRLGKPALTIVRRDDSRLSQHKKIVDLNP